MRNQFRETATAGSYGFDPMRGDSRHPVGDSAEGGGGGLPIKWILGTLRRHWGKSALFMIAILLLTVGALILAPRSYQSQSTMFVRIGRESVGLDPTATTGQTMTMQPEHEFELNSIAQLLSSRMLIEQVVDQIGPERILNPVPKVQAKSPQIPGVLNDLRESLSYMVGLGVQFVQNLDAISDRDRAIHKLSKSIGVVVPKRSTVVEVSCKAETPELAHDVVEALVAAYLEAHIRVNQTEGAYDFFDEQTEVLRKRLDATTRELRDAKDESGMLSIENQRTMLHDQLTKNLGERMRVEAALAAADMLISSLDESLQSVDSRIATAEMSGMDNGAADRMREKLYELEMRKAQLMTQYTKAHPLVVAIEKQVVEAKSIFNQQPASRTHATQAVNVNHQSLQLSLLNERARAASLGAELAVLQTQQTQLNERRKALNQDELRLNELQRQVNVLEEGYTVHMQSRELSRINEALEIGRISNVNVAQPATFVPRPASPNKLVVVLLGLIVAIGGGLGLPFCFGTPAGPKPIAGLPPELNVGVTPGVVERRPMATHRASTGAVAQEEKVRELVSS